MLDVLITYGFLYTNLRLYIDRLEEWANVLTLDKLNTYLPVRLTYLHKIIIIMKK